METFNDIINSGKPVLIDFYATWCGPCKAMAPVIEQVGKEVQGKARVLKIDVDKNQMLMPNTRFRQYPHLLFSKTGIWCGDIRAELTRKHWWTHSCHTSEKSAIFYFINERKQHCFLFFSLLCRINI